MKKKILKKVNKLKINRIRHTIRNPVAKFWIIWFIICMFSMIMLLSPHIIHAIFKYENIQTCGLGYKLYFGNCVPNLYVGLIWVFLWIMTFLAIFIQENIQS